MQNDVKSFSSIIEKDSNDIREARDVDRIFWLTRLLMPGAKWAIGTLLSMLVEETVAM